MDEFEACPFEKKLVCLLSDPGVDGAKGLDEIGTVHPDMVIAARLQIGIEGGKDC